MSPPVKPILQERLIVNSIDGLDDANTTNSKGEINEQKTLVSLDAVEHEENLQKHSPKVPISKGNCEKDAEECCQNQLDDDNDHLKYEDLELVCLSVSHSTHTPGCLSDHDCETDPKSTPSCSDALNSGDPASLEEVKPQSHPTRKRKTKYGKKATSGKKRRLSIDHYGRCKAAGGGKQTNQTCTTGNGKKATTAVTETCLARGAVGNHGCQGGGGCGDGGEDGDGDDQGHKDKPCAHCFKAASSKKKKKSSSDENKMEVDGSSSHDSAMDVDSRPSQKQVSVGMADDSPHAAKQEEKPPRANEKSDRPVAQQPTLNYFIEWNCRINHYNFCKKSNCDRCRWVVKLFFTFHVDEQKHGCTCEFCNARSAILKYHQQKCTFGGSCRVCKEFVPQSDAQDAQPPRSPLQNGGQYVVRNLHPASPLVPSVDSIENEAVIYCDDSLRGLTHFREHIDYVFKESRMVGKGANGEVHDINLDATLKNKYFSLASDKLVVKKATLKEDEKKIFKLISTHPNFVKTYLVANRTDGKFKNLILMEKCDSSLREYLGTKKRSPNGEILDRYEAMHYWTQILDAVAFLHNLSIPVIHKDIKSANVLLTKETNFIRAKLADFDAVKLLHNEYTHAGLIPKGTEYFIAPEVRRGHAHGRPADNYSMGMFLLELIYGNLMKEPKIALQKLLEIDRDLGELIARCIQDDPQERPTAVQIQNSEVVRRYSLIKNTESCVVQS